MNKTIPGFRGACMAAVAMATLAVASPASAGETAGNPGAYPTPTQTSSFALNLATANAAISRFATPITVSYNGVSGTKVNAVIDTGSLGLVMHYADLPNGAYDASKPPSAMYYSSSGDYIWGRKVVASVNLSGALTTVSAGGKSTTTASTQTADNIDITATECVCKAAPTTAPSMPSGDGVGPATTDSPPNVKQCVDLNNQTTQTNGKWVKLSQCVKQANNAAPWLGVGFGRGNGGAGDSLTNNVFLNLSSMSGKNQTLQPGYVITQQGVTLGVTAANTTGFSTVKLTAAGKPETACPTASLAPWDEAKAFVTLSPASGSTTLPATLPTGALLMDTGIDYMFLTTPQWAKNYVYANKLPLDGANRTIVTPGGKITVSVIQGDTPSNQNPAVAFSYSYPAAAQDPPQASKPAATGPLWGSSVGVWSGGKAGGVTAYNTGRRLLAYADYMFDAACGYVGFKTAAASSN